MVLALFMRRTSVQPDGGVTVAVELLKPMAAMRTSFAAVPVGVEGRVRDHDRDGEACGGVGAEVIRACFKIQRPGLAGLFVSSYSVINVRRSIAEDAYCKRAGFSDSVSSTSNETDQPLTC